MFDLSNMRTRAAFRIGLILTGIWVILAILILTTGSGLSLTGAQGLMAITSFVLPLALIWIAILLSASVSEMRSETQAIRQKMDLMRGGSHQPEGSEISNQLEAIMEMTRQNDDRLSALAERTMDALGQAPPPRKTAALSKIETHPKATSDQPGLPFDEPAQNTNAPISIAEFIHALNFPANAQDKAGFRILRRALEDRHLGNLINTAKDVLSLLAEDDIYMDDLNFTKPSARNWRAFAQGERGSAVSGLASVRDKSALSLTKARLKNDPKFRNQAHIFLRQFDEVLENFETSAEDSELIRMGDTRTARGFMLLGVAAGSFS